MQIESLTSLIKEKQSFLCVGLDTDIQRLPKHLPRNEEGALMFNRSIIDHTKDYAVAYKLNIAFYESMGIKGWEVLEKTLAYIPEGIMTIADAKRGDIGNSSRMYARTFFQTFSFDAVTVAPYMGEDSVTPFLEFEDKWVFLLALTSNKGSRDFQYMEAEGETLYEKVIRNSQAWADNRPGHLGFVIGATRADQLDHVRSISPDAFFLVPGVGAQGGDLHAVCQAARNSQGGLLINSSRGIIYAGADTTYGEKAGEVAQGLQKDMKIYI